MKTLDFFIFFKNNYQVHQLFIGTMIKTESITIKNEVIENEAIKNKAIENKIIKNKDGTIRMKHVVCHCRTKRNIKMTTFICSITNFWDTYNFLDTLTSSNIEG